MDLKQSNKEGKELWSKEYSFTELYNVTDMSIDSVFQVYNKIKDSESYFKSYMKYWKGTHVVGDVCSFFDACYRQTVCSIRNIRKDDLLKCLKEMK